MSDFDKEAERERLREKYERDQQKREASERMSDLLLKGATMTNSHCGNCGDPIFRYDGEEFCPTCQQVVTSDDAAAADAEASEHDDAEAGEQAADEADATAPAETDANGDSPAHIEIKEPDGPAVQTGGDQSADAPADEAETDESEAGTDRPRSTDQGQPTPRDPRQQSEPTSSAPAPSRSQGDVTPDRREPTPSAQTTADAGDDVGAARAALVRTLRTQAQRAEQCDDPRRARDHLATAREAAEALSALSSSY